MACSPTSPSTPRVCYKNNSCPAHCIWATKADRQENQGRAMRIFEINRSQVSEHPALAPLAVPGACAASGYLWISLTREEFAPPWPRSSRSCRRSARPSWWTCTWPTCSTTSCPRTTTTPRSTTCWCSGAWRPARARRRWATARAMAMAPSHSRRHHRSAEIPGRPARAAPRRHPPGRLRGVRPGAAVGASRRRRGARRLCRAAAGGRVVRRPRRPGAGRARDLHARAHQPVGPDAARRQPDRGRLPRPAARAHASSSTTGRPS
jgi:hypothetical protein